MSFPRNLELIFVNLSEISGLKSWLYLKIVLDLFLFCLQFDYCYFVPSSVSRWKKNAVNSHLNAIWLLTFDETGLKEVFPLSFNSQSYTYYFNDTFHWDSLPNTITNNYELTNPFNGKRFVLINTSLWNDYSEGIYTLNLYFWIIIV